MLNRRSALTAAPALAAVPLVAGCAWIEKWTGTTTPEAAVMAVYNGSAFLLPMLDALAVGLSVAVPAAAPALGVAIALLNNNAAPVFQQFVSTMTQVQAQPLVQKIEGYASSAFTSIQTVVNNNPSLAKNASVTTRLAQAQEVLNLFETFVRGVTTPNAAAAARYRAIPLPFLHS